MTLRFTIPFLDLEIFRIQLDIEQDTRKVTPVDKIQKATSRWFFRGMVK